ncbi:naringenin,2-oxoglutarate 3-dioxygenase-like [Chenopodium quinoa]|uniref:Fe2OG dioxygenase domain-containing protein n=1 Tax=Chenopodium quinoa TaxID=63459 RepID=A0A803N807_CHEQI|nr:naringenin,2-oxoglutarate 3-dioxygenase-like [Chenopodium quinoa]
MSLIPTLTSLVKDGKFQNDFIMDEDERPKVAYNQFSNIIPVISLDGIEDDTPGGQREVIRNQIAKACEEWGLFQVVNHGVDLKLVHDMASLSRAFFALPDEEKLRFDMSGGKKGGFIVSSHIQNEIVANWREMVAFVPYPIKERDYSRWPDKPKEWRAVTELYTEKMMGLAIQLLEVLSEAMGLERQAMTKACKEMAQRMAVNFYPKCHEPSLAIGLKRHTDPGTITLLLQDHVGGLQATNDGGQNWITVQPIEGAFVVNLGDHAHYLSNGRFKKADHQAVVNYDHNRLSIATFINPDQEAIVYPLKIEEGDKPILEEAITFAEMYKRHFVKHLERGKAKKLAKEKILRKEELEKMLQNSGENVKSMQELLA